MAYGEMVRQVRIAKGITLRELSLRTEIDTARLSRIERETMTPPQSDEILDSINEGLNLTAEESQKFKDQAALDNKKFPSDIKIPKMEGFPMFLRTVANKQLSTKELKELTDFINEQY